MLILTSIFLGICASHFVNPNFVGRQETWPSISAENITDGGKNIFVQNRPFGQNLKKLSKT